MNAVLFFATCLTTWFMGTILALGFYGREFADLWQPSTLLLGLPFSIAIMSILLAHEMGHYLTSRYYGIDASLPYFIPFPNLVGTMGAFIKMRSPFQNRRSLLEVGVMGPIAGFVVAVIAMISSMTYARFEPIEPDSIRFMDPLILKAMMYVMGKTPPEGMDVFLHPVSFAAWFGFFVTALNLLPAAQLDGGHIVYALFPRHHKWISGAVVAVLIPLAVFYWYLWVVWIVFLLFLRLSHPPTLDDQIPLQPRQVILGFIALALLVLCFVPAPFLG